MTTDRLPILLRERAALLHDSIRQAKPSDVVQQPSRVRELALARRHTGRLRDVARERGDARGVARSSRVAHVERPEQPREHTPGERGVLPSTPPSRNDQARHVGVGEDADEDEERTAETQVGVDGRGRNRHGDADCHRGC